MYLYRPSIFSVKHGYVGKIDRQGSNNTVIQNIGDSKGKSRLRGGGPR